MVASPPQKLWVIGDIQGCFHPFQALLHKIQYNPQHHALWLTGDLVNRGPDSLAMLQWAYAHQNHISIVLGNHDLHLLTRYHQLRPAFSDDTLDEVLHAPDAPDIMQWLKAQPLAFYDPHRHLLMVHAGIAPSWTEAQTLDCAREVSQALQGTHAHTYLAKLYGNEPSHWKPDLSGQDRLRAITNFLTRVRFCDLAGGFSNHYKGPIDTPPENEKPWYLLADQLKPRTRVVFGHWSALNGVTNAPKFINLDTGCVWGKTLTAWSPDTDERVSVPGEGQ